MSNTLENIKGLFRSVIGKLPAKTSYSTTVTASWLKNKIRELLAKKDVAKVAVMTMDKLIEVLPNEKPLEELRDYYNLVIATVNVDGKIKDIKFVKDKGSGDPEVDKLLGDESMVVVNGDPNGRKSSIIDSGKNKLRKMQDRKARLIIERYIKDLSESDNKVSFKDLNEYNSAVLAFPDKNEKS